MAKVLYIDFERCIGCRACMIGCEECSGHDHISRAFVDELNPGETVATSPTMCMHCVQPACAESCPVQAIQVVDDGVVLSASHEKCIACKNCTYACPFGIPRVDEEKKLMLKCDLCYERTSQGRPPMCVSVCPTDTIRFLDMEEARRMNKKVQYQWNFGETVIETRTVIGIPDTATHRYGYNEVEEWTC